MIGLIGAALRLRWLVLAVAAGVLVLGVHQLRTAPVDVLPEFTPPYAEIQTEALGLSADEVEQLITVPLEADLLNGVEGVEVIRSDSLPGLSSIVLVFAQGTDVYRARQLVEERLTQAHALPNVSKPPTLLQPLSSSNRVLMIGLSSDKVSAIEQSVIARWTVRPRLMGVPGVANVAVWGMRDQQLQIQIDPARLQAKGVTLQQVIESAGNAQVVSPLSFLEASTPGTGGFIETPQQRLQVRHELESIADPAELGKVPVTGTGGRLRLSDVATVVVDHQPLIGDAVVGSGPGLLLVVEKFPGADTLTVTRQVEQALEGLRPGLAGMTADTSGFRPADYLEQVRRDLGLAVLVGVLCMLLIMAALRFHWRAVLVALVSVPLSLVAAGLVLHLMGRSLNALVLAGVAAAVAVVVDESVVPTDHVLRRLRHRHGPAREVVEQASTAVRRPLVYATLILLLVALPVAAVSGRPGSFFAPMALAYVVAIGVALVVAFTVTPALSSVLLTRWQPAPPSGRSTRVRARYSALLGGVTGGTALIAAGVLFALGAATVPLWQGTVVPSFQDRSLLVHVEGRPGASQPQLTAAVTSLSARLEKLPGVAGVMAHTGRAVTGDRIADVNAGDLWVTLTDRADHDATRAAVTRAAADLPDVRSEVVTPTTQALRDIGALRTGTGSGADHSLDLLTGADRPLVVRLFGQDQQVLSREAGRVEQRLAAIAGITATRVDAPATQSTIEIEVDLDRARALGVTPGDVRRAEATLLQGIQVGSVFQQQKVFDVVVQGAPGIRRTVEDVRNLLIDGPDGTHLRIGQVADVRVVQTPSVIRRDAVSRRLDIEVAVAGRSTGDVAADIERSLAAMAFPLEYHAEVLQESSAREAGLTTVAGTAVAVVLAALLLLQAAFRSWRLALLVLASWPLSLVGAAVAGVLQGGLTLGHLLGMLAVLGIAVRSSLLLVEHLQEVDRPDGSRLDLVHWAARDRLAPVLTTAAAVALLVLPLVVLGVRPGLEILHPLSVALLGGLVTSTFVTLFLLPTAYLLTPPPPRDRVIDLVDREPVPSQVR